MPKTIIRLFVLIQLFFLLQSCACAQQPADAAKPQTYNQSFLVQLTAMQTKMHNGAAQNMQDMYPEGFVFMNALYGLSWAEFAQSLDRTAQAELYKRAETEINWSLTNLNSATAKSTFPKEASIPYGAFYTGWTNYLLGKKLNLQPIAKRDTAGVRVFENQCRRIAAFIDSSNEPYAESYISAAWPADMTVCVASLVLHDKILKPQYERTKRKWIAGVKQELDNNGLMPHAIKYQHNTAIQDGRGSSQGLLLCFLHEIDSAFAANQFHIYRQLFLTHIMGMPGIREYPAGNNSMGDADSGPLVDGVGASASLVGIRTLTLFGDTATASGLRTSIEAFRITQINGSQKKFIMDRQPMADAFLLWANSAAIEITAGTLH